jgi:signal transduction histidine kinase
MINLVELHRLESGEADLQLKETSVEEILSDVVDLLASHAEESGVDVEVSAVDAMVVADRERLAQAVGHLLSNALKASSAGETVDVTATLDAGSVTISVVDRGRGIPKAQQPGLFDRYRMVTGSAPRPKKGLGLALAQAIVERHDGTIGVDSEEGKGSRFWMKLPTRAAIR